MIFLVSNLSSSSDFRLSSSSPEFKGSSSNIYTYVDNYKYATAKKLNEHFNNLNFKVFIRKVLKFFIVIKFLKLAVSTDCKSIENLQHNTKLDSGSNIISNTV